METARDLACADLWQASLGALARAQRQAHAQLAELFHLQPERDLSRVELLRESAMYSQLRRSAVARRPSMVLPGAGGISALALLAATTLPGLLGGRDRTVKTARITYRADEHAAPVAKAKVAAATASASAQATALPRTATTLACQRRERAAVRRGTADARAAGARDATARVLRRHGRRAPRTRTSLRPTTRRVASRAARPAARAEGPRRRRSTACRRRRRPRCTRRRRCTRPPRSIAPRSRSTRARRGQSTDAPVDGPHDAAVHRTPVAVHTAPATAREHRRRRGRGRDRGRARAGDPRRRRTPSPSRTRTRWRPLSRPSRRRRPPQRSAPGHYANPLAGAHVTPERIDQGVDYSGSGPLGAIGDGKITYVGTSGTGWPGAFIEFQLTDGPDAGRYVYYAEGISPAAGAARRSDRPGRTADRPDHRRRLERDRDRLGRRHRHRVVRHAAGPVARRR